MTETSPRNFKTAVYGQLARIGKSLASGPRLELLDLLSQRPRTVEELSQQVGQSVANTSHHLQVLRRARMVDTQRSGVFVTYRLADAAVAELVRALRVVAEARLLELDEVVTAFRHGRGDADPVDASALLAGARRGDVTLLDVRPRDEFDAGHLMGAISVPLAQLEQRLAELPSGRQVVAYCRGKYCVMAPDAVALLRKRGFDAVHLDEGVADWRARGLALEAS